VANDPLRSHPVFGRLKRMRGIALVLLDDEHKVAVPKSGARWRKLADVMDGIDWEVCKAFDAAGTLIGVVKNETDDDETDDDEEDAHAGEAITLAGLAKVLVDVQRASMTETRQMFVAQMDGNARIIEGMAEANRTIADSYALALRVQSAAAISNAAGGESGSPEVMEMLKMAVPMMFMSRQSPPAKPAAIPPPRIVRPQPRPQPKPQPQPQPKPPIEVTPTEAKVDAPR